MLKLIRQYLETCTPGRIFFEDNPVCYTLERPWLNNEPMVSCVSAGIYELERYDSAKFPDCFSLLSGTLGVGLTKDFLRTYILMHPANEVKQLHGCIAPGLGLIGGIEDGQENYIVSSSRNAMEKLRVLIFNNKITKLEII